MNTSVIVLDIEGTVSATSSVHVGLYNYARPRLLGWIEAHSDDFDVADAVRATREQAALPPDASTEAVVAALHAWMDQDIKATPLKTLQGQIWASGFEAGELTTHFFADVPPRLHAWHQAGLRLAVFSSGSVASQRPWFAHSTAGDLTPLISAYFDTVNAGPKREPASYAAIAAALEISPAQALFLTDVPGELDAAVAAGWRAIGVRREGEPAQEWDFGQHSVVASFDDVQP